MIAQLKGEILSKSTSEIIINCGGVGYSAMISVITSEKLPESGNEVMIYTLLIPREDSLTLYGFWNKLEREAFKILISISGIGPKIALGILSAVTVEELQQFILQSNLPALIKMPGIGKKTAERLILELKDKIIKIGDLTLSAEGLSHNLIKQETYSALITLGYSRAIADKAIRKALEEIGTNDISAEKLIRLSLKYAIM